MKYLFLFLFFCSAASAGKVDKILVYKSQKRLILLSDSQNIAEYRIALGPEPKGHKVMEGDGRTPEGRYNITWKKKNSDFHLALYINYPNSQDKQTAKRLGVAPGGNIFIHGFPNKLESYPNWIQNLLSYYSWLHSYYNWTDGCIAVTNSEIEEIWSLVAPGTPIEILP